MGNGLRLVMLMPEKRSAHSFVTFFKTSPVVPRPKKDTRVATRTTIQSNQNNPHHYYQTKTIMIPVLFKHHHPLTAAVLLAAVAAAAATCIKRNLIPSKSPFL